MYGDSVDQRNNRLVAFDKPVAEGGRGWYYLDTNEADQGIRSISKSNLKLFEFLDKSEEDFALNRPT